MDLAGEARSLPGVSEGSETGPMIDGVRVALRTLSVPLAPEPVQKKILRSTYPLAGLQGLFPGQRSAAFCGADHRQGRGHGGDLQGFFPGRRVDSTALRGAEPRGALRLARAQAWRRSGGPVLRREEAHAPENLDIISMSPLRILVFGLMGYWMLTLP